MAAVDEAFHDDLIRNAARLLKDATLLVRHERYGSAFALAALALEEVGKLILSCWFSTGDAPRLQSDTSHVRKQRAFASILVAHRSISETTSLNIDIYNFTENDVESLAKTMYASREGRFSQIVAMTALDRTKQCAIYMDRDLLDPEVRPEKFSEEDVRSLLDRVQVVVPLLQDAKTMRVGKAIFVAGCEGRLTKRRKLVIP